MINQAPIKLRFKEIERQLDYLKQYQSLYFNQFSDLPKDYGGATRFIQLIAKYTIEIAAQLAYNLKIEWSDYRGLFAKMQSIGAIDQELAVQLGLLSDFYQEKTLRLKKLKDIYEMTGAINDLAVQYSRSMQTYLNNND